MEYMTTTEEPKRKRGRPRRPPGTAPTPRKKQEKQDKRIKCDRKRVKRLALQGISCTVIAKDQGVYPSTICTYLAKIGLNSQELEKYKKERADVKAFIGMKGEDVILRTLNTYDDNTISTMDPKTKNGLLMSCNAVVGTRHQEERLERDLSTNNTATVLADVAALRNLDREPDNGCDNGME